jgi:hypothetical protein
MELEKINQLPILEKTVVLAYRDTLTDCTPDTLTRTHNKLKEDFPKANDKDIVLGIRNGLKGDYGIPLKVSPAVVSYWVTKYLESQKTSKNNMFQS